MDVKDKAEWDALTRDELIMMIKYWQAKAEAFMEVVQYLVPSEQEHKIVLDAKEPTP